jgi:hypothetical protein
VRHAEPQAPDVDDLDPAPYRVAVEPTGCVPRSQALTGGVGSGVYRMGSRR